MNLKKKNKRMDNKLYSSFRETVSSSKNFVLLVLLALAILYLVSGVYSISQNEIGVLQRFGRIINDKVMPGIHFSFPWPIDKVNKVPVRTVNRILIDDFSQMHNRDSFSSRFYDATGLSSYCVTGDNNIVNISCGLQYSVSEPIKYLFCMKDPENALHDIACNSVIHCLSLLSVDEVLTYGKRKIEVCVKDMVQEKLNSINCGLSISFVELKEINPPKRVQEHFDDVINSKIDKRKMVSEAESYRNEKIPQANTLANEMIESALSYQKDVIAKAEGESSRFLDILDTYKQAKGITRRRLYLEFMKDIFTEVDDVFIVSEKGNSVPAKIKLFSVNK